MKSERVWIEHLRLRGYRSCLSTSFRPGPDLTVLIGPNGSGKTNILHGVLLLREFGRRRPRRSSSTGRPSRCLIQASFRVGKYSIPYRAFIYYVTNDGNQDEVVSVRERWNFRAVNKVDKWIDIGSERFHDEYYSQHLKLRSSGYKVVRSVGISSGRSIYQHDERYFYLPKKIRPILAAISEYRSRIGYYSASQFTNPSRCPSSFEIDEDGDLRESGLRFNEHLRFVFDLYRLSKNNSTAYDQYLSIVGKRGIGLIEKFSWKQVKVASSTVEVTSGGKVVKDRRERLLIIPNVHIKRLHLSFNQLSEGTFKTLALLFYLVTDRSGLLLVEEPEVCVHHGLLGSVIEIIKSFSDEKQIVCSTHSDFVLDSLEPEQVLTVRNERNSGTIVKSISQSVSRRKYQALKEYLRSEGNLGEYWRHGGLDD